MVEVNWKDRKRIIFGLPWSFTKYGLSEDRLFLEKGLFSTSEDEIRLYRVLDVSLKRSLMQKIFGLGTIICHTSDKTHSIFEIKNIKKPKETKEMLSSYIEEERQKKRVSSREFIMDTDDI